MQKSVLIYLIIGYLFINFYFFNRGINSFDEGYILQGIQRISMGQIPYRDFFIHVTPGTFYLQYFLHKIFFDEIIVGRIWVSIEGIIILLFLYKISKYILPSQYLFYPSLLYIFWGNIHLPLPWYSFDALFFSIIYFYCLIKSNEEKKFGFYPFLCGFFTMLVFYFKQNLGVAIFLISMLSFIFTLQHKKIFLFYILGLFMGSFLFSSFLINGVREKFLEIVLFSPIKKWFLKEDLPYVGINKFPFPGGKGKFIWSFLFFLIFFLKSRIKHFCFTLWEKRWIFYFYFCSLIGVCLFQIFHLEEDTLILRGVNSFLKSFFTIAPILYFIFTFKKNKEYFLFLIYNLCYISFGLLSGEDFSHFLYILPISLITFIKTISELFPKKKIFLSIISFICIWGLINALRNTSQKYIFGPIYKQNELLNFSHCTGIFIEKDMKNEIEKIVEFIQRHTKKKDPIFIYAPDAVINYLSNRENAGEYILLQKLFISEEIEKKIVNTLIEREVKLVIYRTKTKYNPFLIKEIQSLRLLKNYIIKNFRPIFSTENFVILERNEEK